MGEGDGGSARGLAPVEVVADDVGRESGEVEEDGTSLTRETGRGRAVFESVIENIIRLEWSVNVDTPTL